ncbi:MAG TPA: IS701 family transposase [Rubrivivax sp.]|nr:IS701 family transposase [Rubrivivax sp.]
MLGPDGRKSLQPLATRLGLGGHDQLQHFIASPAWDDAPLRRVLVAKADALVGGPGAVLVVDDTACAKKGRHSVGVARQYCGALGKPANCQVLVSLTLAQGEVPVPLGLRLFLPDEWAKDPDRCAEAGVPEEHRRALAKTEIALAEIDRVIAAGARFGRVLADAGYGMGAAFRQGLSTRGFAWAVGVLKTQNVYLPTVELRWPTTVTRRPRKHPVPSEAPSAAEAVLASADWRRISWRHGTKGPLAAEFAALRVRPAEGDQLRNGWHLPGEEVWLVGERRASGEQKYYLSNLPADTPLDELAATIKARWVCEVVFTQMTKAHFLAAGAERDDVADLDLTVADQHPIDQQLHQLPPLREIGIGQAGSNPPAEVGSRGGPAGELGLPVHFCLQLAGLRAQGLQALLQHLPPALVFRQRDDGEQVRFGQPLQLPLEAELALA